MIGGPTIDATTIDATTTRPKTASRLRRSRRQASFQSDVPATGSSVGGVRRDVQCSRQYRTRGSMKRVRDVDQQIEEQDRDRR